VGIYAGRRKGCSFFVAYSLQLVEYRNVSLGAGRVVRRPWPAESKGRQNGQQNKYSE
jgi:hypothetical protein